MAAKKRPDPDFYRTFALAYRRFLQRLHREKQDEERTGSERQRANEQL
jgi:hypothetical protein